VLSAGTAVACGATGCAAAVATIGGGVAVAGVGVAQTAQGVMGLGGNLALLSSNSDNSSEKTPISVNYVNNQNTQAISGFYRGAPVTNYYNPTPGLWVAVDLNGDYVAGWELSSQQINYLLATGQVK
jgi:hypothetical protein